MKIYKTCGRCKGAGKIELTGEAAITLYHLRQKGSIVMTGARLGRQLGVSIEAMANRLKSLEKMGLAKSVRFGRELHWEAV